MDDYETYNSFFSDKPYVYVCKSRCGFENACRLC